MEQIRNFLETMLNDDYRTKHISSKRITLYNSLTEEYIMITYRKSNDTLICVGNLQNSIQRIVPGFDAQVIINYLDENLEDMFNSLDEFGD